MSLHELVITVARDFGRADLTIKCNAVAGAWCRMWCPDGCEAWSPDHEETAGHPLIDYGKCLAAEWFDEVDDNAAGCFDGDEDEPISSGPVDVYWQDDSWVWDFAKSTDEPLPLPLAVSS